MQDSLVHFVFQILSFNPLNGVHVGAHSPMWPLMTRCSRNPRSATPDVVSAGRKPASTAPWATAASTPLFPATCVYHHWPPPHPPPLLFHSVAAAPSRRLPVAPSAIMTTTLPFPMACVCHRWPPPLFPHLLCPGPPAAFLIYMKHRTKGCYFGVHLAYMHTFKYKITWKTMEPTKCQHFIWYHKQN